MRFGLLSTARINDRFLAGVAASQSCDVLAIASRDRARAADYAREHGIERAYGTYEELLADPDVEAVYVSLPNGLHVEWTRRALDAGKHVLCEKPLSRRAGEARAVFDLAEETGRVLTEAFMYRHHPQTARVAELVSAGALGRLRLVRASFGFLLRDAGNPRLSAALEGGALMDVGCYCVNAARLLAGEPVAVSAMQVRGPDGVDVSFAGVMRFADGVLATFDSGFVFAHSALEVVGEEASLFVADPWHCRRPGIELRHDGATERVAIADADPYRLEADDLAAAVRERRPPLLGRADGIGQARTIEALYWSAESGRARELRDE
ncbi:MAG: Gfo/Idh/MocA family oxidoreductase [Solirubrobacteraceae bacterium]